MSLVVNNNLMAANTARNLNAHYGRLATSTQRLSTGLRVNSAADDAAGLAIRELQRADIAALHQGARNANDAISMIQVADGSLGIIDEKLIRMKELAEQAATGTYDSTQRMMIESEYQAMASEITRIANATDFNGTKLLDGTLAGDHDGSGLISEGKMKIHFGTGNDSAEDYYYVEIGECTSEAFGLGNASTWQDVQRRANEAFKDSMLKQIKASTTLDQEDKAKMMAQIEAMAGKVNDAINNAIDPVNAYTLWAADDGIVDNPDINNYDKDKDPGFLKPGKNWVGNSNLMNDFLAVGAGLKTDGVANANAGIQTLAEADGNAMADAIKQKAEQDINALIAALGTGLGTDFANLTDPAADADTLAGELDGIIDTAMAGATFDATALTGELKDLVAAAKGGLINADKSLNKQALGNLQTSMNETIKAQGTKPAQDAAKDVEFAKYPKDASDITSAITTAFNDYIEAFHGGTLDQADPNRPGGAITDANVATAVGGAIDAAVARAKELGMSDDNAQALGDELKNNRATGLQDAIATAGNAYVPGNVAADTADIFSDGATGVFDTDPGKAAVDRTAADNAAAQEAAERALAGAATVPGADKIPENAKDPQALRDYYNGLRTTQKQKLQYAWGQAALYNLANLDMTDPNEWTQFRIGADLGQFSELAEVSAKGAEEADKIFQQALKDMQAKVGHMDFAGHTIETQEDAQMALDAINEAIVSKDKIRAHLGAAQNRLENTVSNLNIQAENLQAAESRISDVDVATEMTQFVRNQILTQSAVAMLSQANSLPQMAMQLIGG